MRALVFLLLPLLSGCVMYPRPYFTKIQGRAQLEPGEAPARVQAAIIKECATLQGETETVRRLKETTTDSEGRYKMRLWGLVWHSKSFVTPAECDSRVQQFICRPHCKPADDVDIEVLGK